MFVAEVASEVLGWSVPGWSTYGEFWGKPGYRHSAEHSVYVAAESRRQRFMC